MLTAAWCYDSEHLSQAQQQHGQRSLFGNQSTSSEITHATGEEPGDGLGPLPKGIVMETTNTFFCFDTWGRGVFVEVTWIWYVSRWILLVLPFTRIYSSMPPPPPLCCSLVRILIFEMNYFILKVGRSEWHQLVGRTLSIIPVVIHNGRIPVCRWRYPKLMQKILQIFLFPFLLLEPPIRTLLFLKT